MRVAMGRKEFFCTYQSETDMLCRVNFSDFTVFYGNRKKPLRRIAVCKIPKKIIAENQKQPC